MKTDNYEELLAEFIEKEIRQKHERSHNYWLTAIGHFKVSYQGKYHPPMLGGERMFEDDYHGYRKLFEGVYEHEDVRWMYIIDGHEYSITWNA